jgi:NAD(P)-dependent dehydrogenase (short-subunit alcohol dehydrogenase family)
MTSALTGKIALITAFPTEGFRHVLEVNALGIFLGLKRVIPVMAKAGCGSIINSSSVAGMIGSPGLSAYVASKHAVLGLKRAAAVAWGGKGLRANCINLGPNESRHRKRCKLWGSRGRPQGICRNDPDATLWHCQRGRRSRGLPCQRCAGFAGGGAYPVVGGLTAACTLIGHQDKRLIG